MSDDNFYATHFECLLSPSVCVSVSFGEMEKILLLVLEELELFLSSL